MSRLFVELYLDEDVDALITDLVRARSFHAITTQEAGQTGKNDAEQLAYAVDQQKTILTHNRSDFESLAQQYLAAGQTHYSIILAARRWPYGIVRRLLIILSQVTADEMENQLRYI